MNTRLSSRWFLAFGVAALTAGACSDDSKEKNGACETGAERCACFLNDTCNSGLTCLSGLCVDPDAPDGSDAGANGSEYAGGPGAGAGSPSRGGAGGRGSGGSAGRISNAGTTSTGGASSAGRGGTGSIDTGPTPVEIHGALSVVGTELVDASGARVKLEGISSMWLNWDPTGYAESKAGLAWMRDNWNLRVIRAAMGVDAEGAYLEDPAKAKAQVNRIVQNAVELGLYVIIDWHDHEALAHQAEATAFFDEMSAQWGDQPNVLYEVFNEPLALDWATQLKPYHQALVSTIRANDPDNLIVLGTPNWDQDVDVAAQSPLSGTNLMYALHFYACSHQTAFLNKAKAARSRGLPLFVTEWGATDADGGVDGVVCEAQARAWHDWLDSANISWTAWKLDGCTDSSCMFKDRSVPVDGGWTSAELNGHAPLVIAEMMSNPSVGGTGGTGSGGTGGTGAGSGGKGGGAGSGGSGPALDLAPKPAGCKLVTSCPTCCETMGVFALDTASMNATESYVSGFTLGETTVTASFDFLAPDEVGSIFFRFTGPQDIGSLGVSVGGTGGTFEVALVYDDDNGCIYPISGSTLASSPSYCWGDGAGPIGYPANQIEVRVRSLSSGHAVLTVGAVEYGP